MTDVDIVGYTSGAPKSDIKAQINRRPTLSRAFHADTLQSEKLSLPRQLRDQQRKGTALISEAFKVIELDANQVCSVDVAKVEQSKSDSFPNEH